MPQQTTMICGKLGPLVLSLILWWYALALVREAKGDGDTIGYDYEHLSGYDNHAQSNLPHWEHRGYHEYSPDHPELQYPEYHQEQSYAQTYKQDAHPQGGYTHHSLAYADHMSHHETQRVDEYRSHQRTDHTPTEQSHTEHGSQDAPLSPYGGVVRHGEAALPPQANNPTGVRNTRDNKPPELSPNLTEKLITIMDQYQYLYGLSPIKIYETPEVQPTRSAPQSPYDTTREAQAAQAAQAAQLARTAALGSNAAITATATVAPFKQTSLATISPISISRADPYLQEGKAAGASYGSAVQRARHKTESSKFEHRPINTNQPYQAESHHNGGYTAPENNWGRKQHHDPIEAYQKVYPNTSQQKNDLSVGLSATFNPSRLGYYNEDYGYGHGGGHTQQTFQRTNVPQQTVVQPPEEIVVTPVELSVLGENDLIPGLCSRVNLPNFRSDLVRRDLTGQRDFSYFYSTITRARVENNGISLNIYSVSETGEEKIFGEFRDVTGVYRAREISFTHPSHHSVDGQLSPLEMYIDHTDTTATGAQATTTLSVLFKYGVSNPFLANLISISSFPRAVGGRAIADTLLDVFDVLGSGDLAYLYNGSQTFLPCDPLHRWAIAYPPIEASALEINTIASALLNSTLALNEALGEVIPLVLGVSTTPGKGYFKMLKFDEFSEKVQSKWQKDMEKLNTFNLFKENALQPQFSNLDKDILGIQELNSLLKFKH
eukprot:GHVN01092170.1.p1 GENE.GHVN01092170.1~~GHVN01092170.1.p1  ORF type:complete len:718 (-),score=89.52 GHVN01092170.1:145-2298(-)